MPTVGEEAAGHSAGTEAGITPEVTGKARRKLPRMPRGRMGGFAGTIRTALRLEPSASDILQSVLFCECSNIHKSRE